MHIVHIECIIIQYLGFTTPQQGLFKVSDYAEKMENLGKDFEIFLPPVDKKNESLGDVPSRFVTGVLDFGTLEKKVQEQSKKCRSNGISFSSNDEI